MQQFLTITLVFNFLFAVCASDSDIKLQSGSNASLQSGAVRHRKPNTTPLQRYPTLWQLIQSTSAFFNMTKSERAAAVLAATNQALHLVLPTQVNIPGARAQGEDRKSVKHLNIVYDISLRSLSDLQNVNIASWENAKLEYSTKANLTTILTEETTGTVFLQVPISAHYLTGHGDGKVKIKLGVWPYGTWAKANLDSFSAKARATGLVTMSLFVNIDPVNACIQPRVKSLTLEFDKSSWKFIDVKAKGSVDGVSWGSTFSSMVAQIFTSSQQQNFIPSLQKSAQDAIRDNLPAAFDKAFTQFCYDFRNFPLFPSENMRRLLSGSLPSIVVLFSILYCFYIATKHSENYVILRSITVANQMVASSEDFNFNSPTLLGRYEYRPDNLKTNDPATYVLLHSTLNKQTEEISSNQLPKKDHKTTSFFFSPLVPDLQTLAQWQPDPVSFASSQLPSTSDDGTIIKPYAFIKRKSNILGGQVTWSFTCPELNLTLESTETTNNHFAWVPNAFPPEKKWYRIVAENTRINNETEMSSITSLDNHEKNNVGIKDVNLVIDLAFTYSGRGYFMQNYDKLLQHSYGFQNPNDASRNANKDVSRDSKKDASMETLVGDGTSAPATTANKPSWFSRWLSASPFLSSAWSAPQSFVTLVVLVYIWFQLWSHRVPASIVGASYLTVIEKREYWRLLTATYSHIDIWHIAFNGSSLLVQQARRMQQRQGITGDDSNVNLATNILTQSYRETFGLGYSCVLFGWMVFASALSPSICPLPFFSGICFPTHRLTLPRILGTIPSVTLTFNFGVIALLGITKIILPQSSFFGHLSGVIIGYGISWGLFRTVTPPCLFLALLAILFYMGLPDANHDDTLSDNMTTMKKLHRLYRAMFVPNACQSYLRSRQELAAILERDRLRSTQQRQEDVRADRAFEGEGYSLLNGSSVVLDDSEEETRSGNTRSVDEETASNNVGLDSSPTNHNSRNRLGGLLRRVKHYMIIFLRRLSFVFNPNLNYNDSFAKIRISTYYATCAPVVWALLFCTWTDLVTHILVAALTLYIYQYHIAPEWYQSEDQEHSSVPSVTSIHFRSEQRDTLSVIYTMLRLWQSALIVRTVYWFLWLLWIRTRYHTIQIVMATETNTIAKGTTNVVANQWTRGSSGLWLAIFYYGSWIILGIMILQSVYIQTFVNKMVRR
eukprot:g1633.t1